MRLCIIGNSHIAALKGGWEAGVKAEFPGIRPTFFGARGGGLTRLMVRGGILTSDDAKIRSDLAFTSGGQMGIDPGLFDAFLVYGLCRNVNLLVRNYGAGYSRQVLEAALLDYWAATSLIGVIRKLREITTLPIHAGASPLEAALGEAGAATTNHVRFLDASNRQVFALLDAELIGQPVETIVNGDATALAFASGSTRLAVGAGNDLVPHEAGETRHMNADFGARWLRSFLTGLSPG
ncbi:MAG: hypothetical protein K8F59_06310 [Rhodobacteraceae bacterium]|nr:hypothetical protein [Paracoccaceae bacterium]